MGVEALDGNQLSEAAETWRAGLSGVDLDQITFGLEKLVLENIEWPPSLPEFREICLSKNLENALSLHEIIRILAAVSSRQGSIAKRYQHPLAFAIAQQIDMHFLRTASHDAARKMVKPAYDKIVCAGWPDFPAHAFVEKQAITKQRQPITDEMRNSLRSALRIGHG